MTSDPNSQKFITAFAVGILILLVGYLSKRKLSTKADIEAAVIPQKKLSLFNFFDLFVEGFIKYHDNVLGKENRKYASFSASIFLFIFLCNLIGLFPGMAAVTTSVWINVGMAIVVFIYFNAKGIEANGWFGHFKHFCGPLYWLAWFMFPIEILGAFLRIVTLNLRLYWNINADHLVLGIFTDNFKILGSAFYGLGLFVCLMQAFIFTTLTMVYILLAVQHSEDH
ncbi:UNVERIFIED_CONTAM: hypothetical protein GTU68_019365 [Idotea baltica]|nr:hypothetical protein [Idotea baltica]